MKKDKAWLKGEINHYFGNWWSETIDDVQDLMDIVEILIDQLDEPETLSQEWIHEHSLGGSRRGYVWVDDLEDVLMPKWEKVKVPQFVADWWGTSDFVCLYGGMRCRKEAKFDLISLFHDRGLEDYLWKVEDWIDNNKDDFIDLVNGKSYKVEEEPKYYALIKGNENIDSDDKYWNYCITDKSLSIGDNKVHPDVSDAYLFKATQYQWGNLGINDTNADFVPVEEEES